MFLLAGANVCMCAALCSCALGALLRGVVDPRPLTRPLCFGGVCWGCVVYGLPLCVCVCVLLRTLRLFASLLCCLVFALLSVWAA